MKLCPKCQKQFSDDANFCPVCAARLTAQIAPIDAGDSLAAKFELGDRLGGTRTGAVHRAKDKATGAAVAVKLVSPAVVNLAGVAQRLERELKHIERVASPGVAKVLASGKRGDDSWVAMELLEGAQTLAEAIGARGPIALDFAAHLVEVIGEALIEAAQVGVVHRDLAPKNVLFAGSDIKLINFSLPVPTAGVPGVPEFVAPEQVEGKPVDQRSNLYSLGALYYYVLTGQPVHAGDSPEAIHKAHTGGAITPPSQLAPVPAPVEAAILRALDRSPTKRFLTVRQFVDEVSRIARGDAAAPGSTQPMGKIGRPKAELVQTLLGVRHGSGANGAPALAAAVAAAPTVGAGVPAIAATPASAAVGTATVVGVSQAQVHAAVEASAPSKGQPAGVVPAAAVAPPERSPWAPPASTPPVELNAMAPAAAAMATAAPQIAAVEPPPPVVAPPVVAAPVVPAAPVMPAAPVVAKPATKKPEETKDKDKGKFRETMWFKKGELDSAAAIAAAEERERTGKGEANDKVDSMPMDQRYNDDGSISREDKDKFSLRTGGTQMMSSVKDPNEGKSSGSSMSGKVSEDQLVGEMKGGRGKIIFAIVAIIVALGVLIFFIAK